MSEPDEQEAHQPKTSAPTAGAGAAAAAIGRGALAHDDRGRCRDEQQGNECVTASRGRLGGGQRDDCCSGAGSAPRQVPRATDGHASGVAKKRHRRRPSKKKRRWKPYYQLSWEEKRALEERETARASRVRAAMQAKGVPVAPCNTTQFLMDEHDREEPDLNTAELASDGDGVEPEPEDEDEDDDDEEEEEEEEEEEGGGGGGGGGREFLQRDFSETYEKYHVESLQDMSKQELLREYLELEKCLCRLEEENNRLRRVGGSAEGPGARLRELELERERERELESLRAQNRELRQQNERYEEELWALSSEIK